MFPNHLVGPVTPVIKSCVLELQSATVTLEPVGLVKTKLADDKVASWLSFNK